MNLKILFQEHKFLHFILPIIIIFILQKRFKLVKICAVIFIVGLLKEIYDTIFLVDSIWISIIDIASNVVGIVLGVILTNIKNKFR